jgi:hypothetical protein
MTAHDIEQHLNYISKKEFYKWWDKWKSKPSKIDKVCEYINQQMHDCGNVGIYLPGRLTDRQWRQLREHFKCERQFMGFIHFEKLE